MKIKLSWKWLILVFLATMLALGYALFIGPHMIDQPKLAAYDAAMPLPPVGAVSVEDDSPPLPTPEEAAGMTNPLAAGGRVPQDAVARGKVYYQYYCLACHGPTGDGRGPVAESFFPVPRDLGTPRIAAMSDGQLLLAMLTGDGHKPARTISSDKSGDPGKRVGPTVEQFGPAAADPPSVMQYTVNPSHRWYLVAYVRSLSGK